MGAGRVMSSVSVRLDALDLSVRGECVRRLVGFVIVGDSRSSRVALLVGIVGEMGDFPMRVLVLRVLFSVVLLGVFQAFVDGLRVEGFLDVAVEVLIELVEVISVDCLDELFDDVLVRVGFSRVSRSGRMGRGWGVVRHCSRVVRRLSMREVKSSAFEGSSFIL